jgi:cytochrome c-type biogenesis protein CcmF
MVVAAICLWQGLISHDFNIEDTWRDTLAQSADLLHRFGAVWAGQKGSLLFWAVVLSLFSSLAQWLTSARTAR